MITDKKLAELVRIARAATPGPWSTERPSGGLTICGTPGRQAVYANPPGGQFPAADQRHIAANSPDVTLALIQHIRSEEAKRVDLEARCAALATEVRDLQLVRDHALMQVERLSAREVAP